MAVDRRGFLAGAGASLLALAGCASPLTTSPGKLTLWYWTRGLSDKMLNDDIAGYFEDADQFIDLTTLGAARFSDQYLDWKWQAGTTPDGKLLGFPIDTGPAALFYRHDLFARAGFPSEPDDVARAVSTWDQYFEFSAEIQQALPGRYMITDAKTVFTYSMAQEPQKYLDRQLSAIPQYSIMASIGWVGDLKALIVPAAANAFGIFWMRQYAASAIPDELLEAAKVDGAGFFRTYWTVAMPILRPALAFLGIFTFVTTWNDYLWPLIVMVDPTNTTLQVALSQLNGLYGADYSLVMAGTLMAVIPLLIVFLFGARHFIRNIAAGAVKG